ncbi:uncharacterized protein [Macrobrachium rosenbergii]|uniref:uncharacterized protein n=1 Tax=Macrobrachium rosenbergii TaxID=79674 RepID=UPI0034D4555F
MNLLILLCIFAADITREFYRKLIKGEVELPKWVCHRYSLNNVQEMSTDSLTEISVTCNWSENLITPPRGTSTIDDPSEESTTTNSLLFFNVNLPVEEISHAVEISLTTEPIPTDIMVDSPTSYHVVRGGSRKGCDLLTDSLGFQYVKKRVTSVSTSWICSVRTKKNRCFASVSQQGTTFTKGPKEHNHGGNPGAQVQVQAISMVKAAAKENIYRSSGKIVKDALLTLATGDVELPKVSNLQRTANRAREQLRPKHPNHLEFEIVTSHIPSDFLRDIHHNGQRHLIFASPLQLSFLSKSKIWFIDGTFKVVREPFVQLVSIHSYIKCGDCTKQVPLLFVIMSQRKSTDYTAILGIF